MVLKIQKQSLQTKKQEKYLYDIIFRGRIC